MKKLEGYTIENCIGKHSLGDLYLTTKNNNQKKYISKRYDREEIDKKGLKKFLENEIIFLKYLNHPNCVKIEDMKKSKKYYYIIFEYCNGGNLSEALEKYIQKYGKSFPEEIIQHFMSQIIDAFKYIHDKEIIHRYINIENIFLNYENEEDAKNLNLKKAKIKIVDFNFACRIKNWLKNGLVCKILPEMKNDDQFIIKNLKYPSKKRKDIGYSKKADIWSIGAICYEMLTGIPVLDVQEFEKFHIKIKQGNYALPTIVSREIISFINGMLQYKAYMRLTASQLSRHDFLNKDISQFKKINLKNVSDILGQGCFEIINLNNRTIWSIFNKKDETLLSSIKGSEFVKPIDEKEQFELSKDILNESSVLFSPNGIPDNEELDENISVISKEDL